MIWIDGLAGALMDCYQRGMLPSEYGCPWAKRGNRVGIAAPLLAVPSQDGVPTVAASV
jgi:hypothetical protein